MTTTEQTDLEWIKEANFIEGPEAAKLLRIHEQTLYKWLKEKRIVGSKIGRLWWIPAAEIDRVWREGLNCSSEAASPKAVPVAATRLDAAAEMDHLISRGQS